MSLFSVAKKKRKRESWTILTTLSLISYLFLTTKIQIVFYTNKHFLICLFLAERKTSLGKDWHSNCLRCEKCNKTLTPGSHAEHEGKPYCHNPCYSAMFGPGGIY